MAARIATSEETLAAFYYSVANFKLGEINSNFNLEIEENLNHCNIQYGLNVQKIFC